MRKSVIFALAISIAVVTLNTVPASAADDWSSSFIATGWITSISSSTGNGDSPDSTAIFEMDAEEITGVHINAVDQEIVGGISGISLCAAPACEVPVAALTEAELLAIQSYEFDLVPTGVKTVIYWTPDVLSHEAEVIFGGITGFIGGNFTVGDGPGKTAGSLAIDLEGTGGFVCFAPTPGPLAPCMVNEGQMLPVEMDFTADGAYAIDITSMMGLLDGDTVIETGNIALDMDMALDLTLLAHNNSSALTAVGEITVTDILLSYE